MDSIEQKCVWYEHSCYNTDYKTNATSASPVFMLPTTQYQLFKTGSDSDEWISMNEITVFYT